MKTVLPIRPATRLLETSRYHYMSSVAGNSHCKLVVWSRARAVEVRIAALGSDLPLR
jgi:hypothetical protein